MEGKPKKDNNHGSISEIEKRYNATTPRKQNRRGSESTLDSIPDDLEGPQGQPFQQTVQESPQQAKGGGPAGGRKPKTFSLLGYLRYSQEQSMSPMHDRPVGLSRKSNNLEVDKYDEEERMSGKGTLGRSSEISNSSRRKTENASEMNEDARGYCETILKKCCGERVSRFLVRNRFIFYRLILCICYFIVGIEYYRGQEEWAKGKKECDYYEYDGVNEITGTKKWKCARYVEGYTQSVINALYFITVSTTTVGYGDFVPTTEGNRVFTTFYVTFGILIVLTSANKVIQYFIVKKTQKYILHCIDACVRIYYRECGQRQQGRKQEVSGTSINTSSWFKLTFSVLMLGIMIAYGTIYFMAMDPLREGEGFGFATSLYYTICTMLTIGYGDFDLPPSQRIQLTVYIWLCVIVYVIAITNVVETFDELKAEALRYEILKQHAVDIVDILDEQRNKSDEDEEPLAIEQMTELVKVGFWGQDSENKNKIARIRQSLQRDGTLIGGDQQRPRDGGIAEGDEDIDDDDDKGSAKKRQTHDERNRLAKLDDGQNRKVTKNALGFVVNADGRDTSDLMDDDELDRISAAAYADKYPHRGSNFSGMNPLFDFGRHSDGRSLRNSDDRESQFSSPPEAYMQIKFDELEASVLVSDQDVKNIMRSAKRDRFVLDMLIKTGKLDPKRDVKVLESHFDKVENIRTLATKGDISRDVIANEIGVDAKGGTLMGVAKNLIDQGKAARKHHKSKAKRAHGNSNSTNARDTNDSDQNSNVLENLRRGTVVPVPQASPSKSSRAQVESRGLPGPSSMGRLSEAADSGSESSASD